MIEFFFHGPMAPWKQALIAADNGNSKPLVKLLRDHAKPSLVPPSEDVAEIFFHLADLLDRKRLTNHSNRPRTPSYVGWSPSMRRMIRAEFAMLFYKLDGGSEEAAAERVAREFKHPTVTAQSIIEFHHKKPSQYRREKKRRYYRRAK
jgi:hypothetical protein